MAQYIIGEMPGLQRPIRTKVSVNVSRESRGGSVVIFWVNVSTFRRELSFRLIQVDVPVRVAKLMTYPERVSRYNISKLRERIRNGPEMHPGANLIRLSGGFVKSLVFSD